MGNKVDELKQLIENWDGFFAAQYQRIAERGGSPAVNLWALSRYGQVHDRVREILSEAVREVDAGRVEGKMEG
jgi:hypothetical protein